MYLCKDWKCFGGHRMQTLLTFWDSLGRGPEQQERKEKRTFLMLECVAE